MQETSVNDTESRLNVIIERLGHGPAMLVPVLQAAQNEFKYLSRELMQLISDKLDVPPAKVYGVATFYAHFALEPKGKHVVRICDGTACHVKGSGAIIDSSRAMLGLKAGDKTTLDGLFTIEVVSCLGACGLAPVLLLGEKAHGQVTVKSTKALIDAVKAGDSVEEGSAC